MSEEFIGKDTMNNYLLPSNELQRVQALHTYEIFDTGEEKDFDALTSLASFICQIPVALITFIDEKRQSFKSHHGTALTENKRELSFCTHAIAFSTDIMIVPDARKDIRFADNPVVTGPAKVVFYAGVPLVNEDGFALGTLCVLDQKTHVLSPGQTDALKTIAKQVVDKLELRRKLKQLEEANNKSKAMLQSLQIAHAQLNESETRFRNLIQQAPVAIAVLKGSELIIQSANRQILKLWGKDASVIDMPLHKALPELEGQPFLNILKNVYTSGNAYTGYEALVVLEHKGALKDCYFNFTYQPVATGDGLVSVMVVATEVTAQVEARKLVDDGNSRLELALEAGQLGSYELELETGAISCTALCKKNYGLDANAVLTFAGLLEMIVPEHREQVKEKIDTAVKANTVYTTEYEVVWADGTRHWISASGKPQQEARGVVKKVVGVTLNITERKLFEQRKDEFLAMVSHELKTPLTTLKANLQLLEIVKDSPDQSMIPRLIHLSAKSVIKINAIVDDLLHIHQYSDQQLSLSLQTFTIGDMLGLCCNHVRLAGKHELVIEGEPELKVFADEHRIDQVVVNFVNNAVKYAPESKKIYLIITKKGDFVEVAVKDFGPGIPQEHLPHLFDRYWRADRTSKNYSGLGLGLYICAEIIKRHKGQIGAISTLGEGSTFWFTLPAAL